MQSAEACTRASAVAPQTRRWAAGWCPEAFVAVPLQAPVSVLKAVVRAATQGAIVESTSLGEPGRAVDGHIPVSATVLSCMGTMTCGHKVHRMAGMMATPGLIAGAEGTGP